METTVIGYVTYTQTIRKHDRNYCIGKCICGKIVTRQETYIKIAPKTHSCGCMHPSKNNKGRRSKEWEGYEEIPKDMWSCLFRRGVEVTITIEYLWQIFIKQNRLCALTGRPLHIEFKKERNASIDRIDSKKGYIEGNVRWVEQTVNIIKNDLPEEEFLHWCKLIADNN